MDDTAIVTDAAAEGFELEERVAGNEWVWGCCRGDETRWPCFRERDQALRWMADRLNRVRVFA